MTDGKNWFGIGLEPTAKSVIGSQQVPYIHEDRVSKEDAIAAWTTMYEMSVEERAALGAAGRAHVMKNYNFKDMVKGWDNIFTDIRENKGSWDERKNYKKWTFEEIAA
ncbi:MAG TPA: hypothetical protein VMW36_06165 [Patescibacteria group bacterium]|nr:hypothetical protein [Patescibacteria group bacterium]